MTRAWDWEADGPSGGRAAGPGQRQGPWAAKQRSAPGRRGFCRPERRASPRRCPVGGRSRAGTRGVVAPPTLQTPGPDGARPGCFQAPPAGRQLPAPLLPAAHRVGKAPVEAAAPRTSRGRNAGPPEHRVSLPKAPGQRRPTGHELKPTRAAGPPARPWNRGPFHTCSAAQGRPPGQAPRRCGPPGCVSPHRCLLPQGRVHALLCPSRPHPASGWMSREPQT